MKKSTIAVLLSALVMPGAGHLYLRQIGRGVGLIAISLASLWVILDEAMRQASAVVNQLEAEGGAIDPGHLSELVAQTSASSGSSHATIATLVLTVCWVVGIIDAWRLGKKKETK